MKPASTRRYWIRSVYVKYLLLFIGIVWLSSILAFAAVAPRAMDNLRADYLLRTRNLAANIRDFSRDNAVDTAQVAYLLENEDYEITVFEDAAALQANPRYAGLLTEGQTASLLAGGVAYGELTNEMRLPFAVVLAGDDLVMIQPQLRNNMLPNLRAIITKVLIICAGLGSVLIAGASMVMLRPVKKLTEATREVAKGNFDVQIPVRSGDEIGQLTDNFNTMAKELGNIEILRKDFISNVSHEFKTPITSIQGFARLIRDGGLTDSQFQEYTGIILSESDRLANLSANLLRLSRLDSQAIFEKATRYSLDEQIRKAILLLEDDWTRKQIEFELDLDSFDYLGHEELMLQVWINLVSNAVKFSHESGVIGIIMDKVREALVIRITDHGTGIPSEAQAHVFERFYKADKSRGNEGNGLGLAIVKKIVELHNGTVSLDSSAGNGTTFIVELPS